MEQIHMSNPANMSSGSGMTSGVKGQQQSVADSMGMSQMGQDANGATNFKGLLQGKKLFPEMTEEQEQTVSLLGGSNAEHEQYYVFGNAKYADARQ